MILGYEPSTPDPPNPGQVIDSDYEKYTIETPMEDFFEAKIDHNHPNFHMIQEIVKEEHKYLHASIDSFKIQSPLFLN